MLLTKSQQYRFWREWLAACRAQKWVKTSAEIDTERHAMLQRAGFRSLKDVDPHAGFTAVLRELAALQDNLAGIMRADANPRRTRLHKIKDHAASIVRRNPYCHGSADAYLRKIMLDKFGHFQTDDLTGEQLDQLLSTVAARDSASRRQHQAGQGIENIEAQNHIAETGKMVTAPAAAPVAVPETADCPF